MKFSLTIKTHKRSEMLAIQEAVQALVTKSGIKDGTAIIYSPHTTAGITINENYDPDVVTDTLLALDKMVPWNDPQYRHREGNTAAHIKTGMFGTSATVFVESGKILLGQWQGIFLCEFDGPRTRTVWVKLQKD